VSSLRIILLPMIGLTLSGCTQYWNQYAERKDSITFGAGDAIASNSAVQIPTPWPRHSNDPNIAFDGERINRAVARYREGEKQPVATQVPYGSTFGSSNASSQAPAGAAAPGAAPGEAAGPPGAPPGAEAAPAPAPAPY
jgi:hypothetical protein